MVYPPSWLQSSLQHGHRAAIRALDTRETQRDRARRNGDSSLTDHHLRVSSHHHTTHRPNLAPDLLTHYSCEAARCGSNKHKNRYIDLYPYDRTSVLVPIPGRGEHERGTDHEHRYLNANWVRESVGGKWWIAGQAPLPSTIHAFLTLGMCPVAPPSTATTSSAAVPSRRRIHTIVQLTPTHEGGRRKAHAYFPIDAGKDAVIQPEYGCDAPPIHVMVDRREKIDDAQCVKTDLRLRWSNTEDNNGSLERDQEEWRVVHLFYTAWPDFGVPQENESILHFARLVERTNNRHVSHSTNDPNASPPILVHCSAGVGRTGSFIALSSLLRTYSLLSPPFSPTLAPALAPPLPMSPLGSLASSLDDDLIAKEIDGLREQRQSMVQKNEQAFWVYEALSDAFRGS